MREKVLVIGLDSAALEWVDRWVAEGAMPNLARLRARGATGILRTVNPPLSPAAWSSLATGMLPAKHGIYDHIYRRPGTYDIAPSNAKLRAGKPVWQIISEGGGKVGVINVPETYPPATVNGFMISGMDTPSDESEWAYPANLKAELQAAMGGYKPFGRRSKENLDWSIAGMHQTIPMRVKAATHLWQKYDPNFMILVFMETDVIQHKCWKYMDPAHPLHNQNPEMTRKYGNTIRDIYTLADRELGQLLAAAGDDTSVIVMSDHGAGILRKWLFQNNWLLNQGLMHFKPEAVAQLKYRLFQLGFSPANVYDLVAKMRLGLIDKITNRIKKDMASSEKTTPIQRIFLSWRDVDWSRTKAYTLGGNYLGFYINLKGREPQGCVEPGAEYEAVRDDIMRRIMEWRDPDTGERVANGVYRREELQQGPYADRAPDVLYTSVREEYYGFGGHEFARNILMGSELYWGHHRMDGMITLSGPRFRQGVRLDRHQIIDVAPTILHLLGYAIPADMDGKVMAQALDPAFLSARPVKLGQESWISSEGEDVYSEEEEGEVKERLKALGYL